MKADLGKDEAFSKLFDQCFDFKEIEYVDLFLSLEHATCYFSMDFVLTSRFVDYVRYTYSVCLFGNANQRSHSTTFLG